MSDLHIPANANMGQVFFTVKIYIFCKEDKKIIQAIYYIGYVRLKKTEKNVRGGGVAEGEITIFS